MFEGGKLNLDFFAGDKVFDGDQSVHELARPVYTNNIAALAGINASGKSVALSLIDLVLRIEGGTVICPAAADRGSNRLFTGGTTTYRALLWHENRLYVHTATLSAVGDDGLQPVVSHLRFDEEVVYQVAKRPIRKAVLSGDLDKLVETGEIIVERRAANGRDAQPVPKYVNVPPLATAERPYHLYCEAADMPLSLIGGMGVLERSSGRLTRKLNILRLSTRAERTCSDSKWTTSPWFCRDRGWRAFSRRERSGASCSFSGQSGIPLELVWNVPYICLWMENAVS